MRLQFQDKIYPFEDKLTTAEAMLLYDKSKVGVNLLWLELSQGNPYVVAALLFILAKRQKHVIPWDTLMGENILEVKILADEAAEGDAEDAPAADASQDPPVVSPSGRTRRKGTSGT
jgi:hypothetical protein